MSLLRKPYHTLAGLSLFGIASTSYLYYRRRDQITTANQTFELPVHTRDSTGKRITSMRTMPLLSPVEVEQRLSRLATTGGVFKDGIQWKWHTTQVAANEPIEDMQASTVVERDPPPVQSSQEGRSNSSEGNLLFFTVLDGHGGPYTSRLLSKTLIPAVALELSSLMHQPIPESPPTASSTLSYLSSWVSSTPRSSPVRPRSFDQSPTYVSLAIQTAFANLDSELINAPVRIMDALTTKPKDDDSVRKPHEDSLALASIFPALSGSCALLALLDTGARNMYVACTGDSRAVAGYFDDEARTWTVEVLTEDQTGRNPNELKSEIRRRCNTRPLAYHTAIAQLSEWLQYSLTFLRMQSEHPSEERDAVIQRGRVLGGLEPSRAFGDARYKWSREFQERLTRTFFTESKHMPRPPPANLKTPPYVTPQPVVTHRALTFLPPTAATLPSEDTPRSKMRFLILATDGLWDALSSQDACALVAGHLSGLRGPVPKQELESRLRLTMGAQGVEGKNKAKASDSGFWSFHDENLATHLVRNAFGKGSEQRLRELMSIPAPLARSYRDDTTVTVVWWEEGKEVEKRQVKAKL